MYIAIFVSMLSLAWQSLFNEIMSFREKPKVVTASERKNSSSDGEPEAKRRKVDASETVIVQKVMSVLSKSWLLLKKNNQNFIGHQPVGHLKNLPPDNKWGGSWIINIKGTLKLFK